MATLDGPRVSAANGTAKQLVIFCHGYGANGDDLIGLAHPWQQLLPNAAFVSPNAPEAMPMAPGGFQWFPIDRSDPQASARGVEAAAPILNEFIDEELERWRQRKVVAERCAAKEGEERCEHNGIEPALFAEA